MKPETYAAIQLEWCKISSEEHRALMYDYVTKTNSGAKENWMEFLRRHFKIEESSAQHLVPRNGCGEKLTSAALTTCLKLRLDLPFSLREKDAKGV